MLTAILKPKITRKHSENAKKQLTEKQNNNKYQNTSLVEARFLHLACQGEGDSHPCSSQVTPLIRCLIHT